MRELVPLLDLRAIFATEYTVLQGLQKKGAAGNLPMRRISVTNHLASPFLGTTIVQPIPCFSV